MCVLACICIVFVLCICVLCFSLDNELKQTLIILVLALLCTYRPNNPFPKLASPKQQRIFFLS